MVGYIYSIINEVNGKRYVGMTIDISRRLRKHKTELKNNTHHSFKLQNAWNLYGEENFSYSFREVKINCYNELYKLEAEEIKKYDSYKNGYNCNAGGSIYDWKQKVKNEDVVSFLCIHWYYGNGYGKTFEQIFHWPKGTASAAQRKIRYTDACIEFENMDDQLKTARAIDIYNNYNLKEIALQRQIKQGGCQKAYQLTQDDFNFAFTAQELGYTYTQVANYIGIKPATVKDWFNGRSRKKEKEKFLQLSTEEKNLLIGRCKIAELSGKPKS